MYCTYGAKIATYLFSTDMLPDGVNRKEYKYMVVGEGLGEA